MALVECRRFAILPQALVARSALEAAGLHAVVFDEYRASMQWTEQVSLGGVRVMVLRNDFEAASQLLADLDPSTGQRVHLAPGGPRLGLLFMMLASVVIGWPLAGFRRPGQFHRVSALVLTLVAILAILLPFLRIRMG